MPESAPFGMLIYRSALKIHSLINVRVVFVIMVISALAFTAMSWRIPVVSILFGLKLTLQAIY